MKNKQLAARVAVMAGVATLVVASAFADSRPSDETSWREGDRRDVHRHGDRGRDDYRRGDESRNRRGDERYDRDDGHRRDDRYDRRHDRGRPFYANGRVSRIDRHRAGYRVWVAGARYPFFVPDRYYHRDRFRVGVVINIGGIFNPAGYYDYYDGRGYSRGDLRGFVESVDYRRQTFVIRNEATRSFITVVARDPHRRVRPGDYVELYGAWSRRGIFRARDIDILGRY